MRLKKLKNNQEGLASIIIVVIIISVITIITIGFARVVRREQRQALDQQISAQARYAAESAINEKIAEYRSDPAAFATTLTSTTACTNPEPTFSSGADEIQTTCVLVNPAPGMLIYDQVKTSESTIVWLDPDGTPMDRIVITWQNTDGAAGNQCLTGAYTSLPPSVGSAQIGMLRFDLSRVGEPGDTISRASLRDSAFGGVLYPKQNGSEALTYNPGLTSQPVVYGTCNDTPPAGVPEPQAAYAIINLPNNPALRNSRYILRLRGIYKNSKVRVVGIDPTNQVVEFADAQVSMEATARVGDVVQRIQVRVPAGTPPPELLPDDAIHVTNGGLCKLLETEPVSTIDNCTNPGYVIPAP